MSDRARMISRRELLSASIATGLSIFLTGCNGSYDDDKQADDYGYDVEYKLGDLEILDYTAPNDTSYSGKTLSRLHYSLKNNGDEDWTSSLDVNAISLYQNGAKLNSFTYSPVTEFFTSDNDKPIEFEDPELQTITKGYSYDSFLYVYLDDTSSDVLVKATPLGTDDVYETTYSL